MRSLIICVWHWIQNWCWNHGLVLTQNEANARQLPGHGDRQHRWSCCTHISYNSPQGQSILRPERSVIHRTDKSFLQGWFILFGASPIDSSTLALAMSSEFTSEKLSGKVSHVLESRDGPPSNESRALVLLELVVGHGVRGVDKRNVGKHMRHVCIT